MIELFEKIITVKVADYCLCKLTYQELHGDPGICKTFLARLIDSFMGSQDRRVNELHSHLHTTIDHLATSHPEVPRTVWLARFTEALTICSMSDETRKPLRSSGYRRHRSSGDSRFTSEVVYPNCGPNCKIPWRPPSITTTVFMLAVIRDDGETQASMLAQGSDANTPCFWFGHPLVMAARLGHTRTVTRLLAAGAQEMAGSRNPLVLSQAAFSDREDVVKILLASPVYHGEGIWHFHYVDEIYSARNNRSMLEHLLSFDYEPGSGQIYRLLSSTSEAAARNGWDDLLRLVLEGEDLSHCYEPNNLAKRALESAASGGSLSSCEIIFEHIHSEIPKPENYWQAAAYGGNVKVLELFIQRGIMAECYIQVVITTAMRGHLEMLKYALDNGYHERSEDSMKLLQHATLAAIYTDSMDTVEFLVSRLNLDLNSCLLRQDSAEIDSSDRKARRIRDGVIEIYPLTIAIDIGSLNMVSLLKKLGASIALTGVDAVDFTTESRFQRWNAVSNGVDREHMRWYWKDFEYSILPGHVFRALRVALS